MSTIKHVAARAGVSFTTVSHVVNRTRPVSDDARLRVERAIAELGYFPSAVARALKTSQTRILGVIVPNITNPFFSELMRGIEDVCERSQYSVFLCNGDDDPERQGRSLETLLERRVDGVLRVVVVVVEIHGRMGFRLRAFLHSISLAKQRGWTTQATRFTHRANALFGMVVSSLR